MLQASTLRIGILSRPIAAAAEGQKRLKNHVKADRNSGSEKSLVLHAFEDLSRVSPLLFVHILHSTYVPRNGKAIVTFHALRQQAIHALRSAPPPGPATYVMSCLNALLLLDADSSEVLSHLLTSALSSLNKVNMSIDDSTEARILASKLFHNAITGSVILRVRVVVKLATVFGIQLRDIAEVMCTPAWDEAEKIVKVKTCIEQYILGLIKSRLHTSAVTLFKQFSLQHFSSHEFLLVMIHDNQFEAAEEWAAYMGRYMICSLIRHCTELGLFKKAYKTVQKYDLQQEFPTAYHQYKKSTLRKLIEKECWDVAESIATEDRILVQYMVSVAQEVRNEEKAADLCNRHGLKYVPFSSAQERAINTRYLQVSDYISEENVIWVDTADTLANATRYFSKIEIVGIDCEWRPNLLKEEKTNKVSIMQIATREKVYIIDLIKLHIEKPNELDNCLKYIFGSSNILKLGYALHNDLGQLLRSYKDISCFHYCEPILDLQAFGGHCKGGLSGLAKTTLGGYLNKALRMTDWEKRPLSPNQLHYAALDAAVLIPIFNFMSCEQFTLGKGSKVLSDWKSHVTCFKSNFGHKNLAKKEEKGAPEATQMDAKMVHLNSLAAKDELLHADQESDAVNSFGPKACIAASCNIDLSCIVEEDLVYTSCNLMGLPMPGLLKSELQNYAQSNFLPLPTYKVSQIIRQGKKIIYFCTLSIGSMEFCGSLSYSKREAEISAAINAISQLFKGEDEEGNI